ncbi:MAG: apolipoprotein N-acyltransferase [Deltaproteobacteria bacterium]|nr:MAG: apolipoprotein N-acyltransferase [Deltaproteobacteria bacterium]
MKVPWLLASSSGLLLSVCFSPFSYFPAVALVLVPLIEAVWGKGWYYACRMGFLTGIVHFGTLLWWISPTISQYGNLPGWVAWPVFGLLVCYLAIYPAIWSGLLGYWTAGRSCLPSSLALAGTWTLLEWARGHVLSGFPWGYLAYTLEPVPPLIQTAEIWGPYGLTFLIVLLNVLLWKFFKGLLNTDAKDSVFLQGKRVRPAQLGLFLVCLPGLWFFGEWRMEKIAHNDDLLPELRVAAIQGAVPQDRKWDPAFQVTTLDTYGKLSLKAVEGLDNSEMNRDNGVKALPGLVVWPETATPFYFQVPGPLSEQVRSVARDLDVALLFGSPAYRYNSAGKAEYLNSVYLLNPDGAIAGKYDKRHLVPFGEYLPWGWVTAWAQGLIPAVGQFSPGITSMPLSWQDLHVGVLICFESIFPTLSRETVLEGANFLAVLTNDAWFGRTGAPYQHEIMAIFRAVETRRWVVRAANTGVSSLISPCGVRTAKTSLFEPCYIEGRIHLRKGHTFYVKYGEIWLLLFCLFWAVVPFWRKVPKEA